MIYNRLGASNLKIGCAIMSWKSHETLKATLETYKKQNLFYHFDEILVLFQEISDKDVLIAREYGLNYIATSKNIGIQEGMKLLASSMKSDLILFLENDCILVEEEAAVIDQLLLTKNRFFDEMVDVVRLRSRKNPGEKFDTLDKFKLYHRLEGEGFKLSKFLRKLFRPAKFKRLIGTSLYYQRDPKFEKYLTKMPEGDYIVKSSVMNWTNQSIVVRRDWFLNVIIKYATDHPSRRTVNGHQDIEKSLNSKWWRKSGFRIGVPDGLFSHKRLDN